MVEYYLSRYEEIKSDRINGHQIDMGDSCDEVLRRKLMVLLNSWLIMKSQMILIMLWCKMVVL